MKRKNPQTSLDAYNSLTAGNVRAIYEKIIEALKVLGSAHTEKIAEYLGMEHPKVHKRISEMERLQIVYKPGGRMPMKSGRNGYLWCLTSTPKTDNEVKYSKTDKTAHEYANSIIELSHKSIVSQQSLF